jgi:chemotaxis signal transduction protein
MSEESGMHKASSEELMAERLLEMRRTFDSAFATPRAMRATDVEQAVIIEVGAHMLACRIGQVTRFEADRKVVPLSGPTGLVGIAGIRGKLVPVYSLAVVLGASASGPTRWLALCGGHDMIGLAFERIDRFVHARGQDVCALPEAGPAAHMRELLRVGSASYNILDVASVLAAIKARSSGEAPRN